MFWLRFKETCRPSDPAPEKVPWPLKILVCGLSGQRVVFNWVQVSQIPRDRLVMVIRILQALMLLMVISSLSNLLTAWYSALYCTCNHFDINANVSKI